MAKKVSKNQRTNRGGQNVAMAKIIVSEKKANGQFRFKDKMILADEVQAALKGSRS